MAAPLVTYFPDRFSFQRGESATDAWIVSGAADESAAASAVPIQRGNTHRLDASLIAYEPVVGPWADGTAYEVVVNYAANGGYVTNPDPLKRPMRWRPEPMSVARTLTRDAFGNAILNAAGDPIDGVTEDEDELVLSGTRAEVEYSATRFLTYRRAINADSVMIPKVGIFQPGQLLLLTYTADEFDRDSKYVWCHYRLWARPGRAMVRIQANGGIDFQIWDGHVRALLNVGTRGWSSTTERGPFYDKDGKVSEPIRLDKTGKPVESSTYKVGSARADAVAFNLPYLRRGDASLVETVDDATFIKYCLKQVRPFGPLGLDK